MTDSVIDALRSYVEGTSPVSPALATAIEDAAEFGLPIPDAMTGQLLSTLAATTGAHNAIAVTPAAGAVGLYLLEGLPESAILSCIDPEPEHQRRAKITFREAGYSPSRIRFLPSRPLDVMSRLADGSYQLVYGEVAPLILKSFVDAALRLLAPGGVLILADALLDGTIADSSRKDRDTVAAREADEYFRSLEGVHVTRLPLGAGMTIITLKR
ncbi:O-methyltransferase [Corynebacterium sp. SCR221107]|uniref:O-methyltransferase n=1 Tax=Corynebacterium sp. SCR221107 TaxID=3017361 RepID=UPI0022EC6184|nr:O-methyltransferase [Corynebacterium sp. SCR221107]WBT09724.1 O-methyltransferase [Corynebacterium sp. SCR221107]